MCILSDCVVRIETGLWVIRLHYVVRKPTSEMLLSIWPLWTMRPQCMGVACRGHWPLGTSSAQFTVYRYRLRHSLTDQDSCPTVRTAARPIPEGMTIFCLPTASTSQIRTAWLYLYDWRQYGRPPIASAGLLVCNFRQHITKYRKAWRQPVPNIMRALFRVPFPPFSLSFHVFLISLALLCRREVAHWNLNSRPM